MLLQTTSHTASVFTIKQILISISIMFCWSLFIFRYEIPFILLVNMFE